jgi:hypothetical protein
MRPFSVEKNNQKEFNRLLKKHKKTPYAIAKMIGMGKSHLYAVARGEVGLSHNAWSMLLLKLGEINL